MAEEKADKLFCYGALIPILGCVFLIVVGIASTLRKINLLSAEGIIFVAFVVIMFSMIIRELVLPGIRLAFHRGG